MFWLSLVLCFLILYDFFWHPAILSITMKTELWVFVSGDEYVTPSSDILWTGLGVSLGLRSLAVLTLSVPCIFCWCFVFRVGTFCCYCLCLFVFLSLNLCSILNFGLFQYSALEKVLSAYSASLRIYQCVPVWQGSLGLGCSGVWKSLSPQS